MQPPRGGGGGSWGCRGPWGGGGGERPPHLLACPRGREGGGAGGAGEIVGVAGLVGSGRTELARTIFGLTPADEGEMLLGGERIRIRAPAQAIQCGIAYVPEDRRQHGVVPDLPISHNVTLASLG